MLKFPDIQRRHAPKSILAIAGLLLLFLTQAPAQSGRRTPKRASQPPPAPPAEMTEEPRKLGERPLSQKVSLLVGRQPTSKHLLSEDAIAANFVKRLSEFTNINASYIGSLNRDRAVKRAKNETEAIVVLLQYDIDNFQNGTIIINSPDMDVQVLTFAPVTGKEKFKGKVYYKAVGGPMMKKDNWPNGTPIRITTEAVGIEAAEQVHDWLLLEELREKRPLLD